MDAAHFIHEVYIDWDAVDPSSYVCSIGALKSLPITIDANVCFFVGENGCGKSTLLEAMAVAAGLNPEGGSQNYVFSTKDTHADLHEALHIRRGMLRPCFQFFLRAESFYTMATAAEKFESVYWNKSRTLHELSHGEAFLATIQEDFRENGLYLLDEPESALSVSRQLTLLIEFDRLSAHGSQLIICTHSPILMSLPGAQILSFTEDGIEEVEVDQTEAYQTMELFIRDRKRLLDRLLQR